MPVTNLDRHNPNFYFFPYNNNRTAWRPYGMPAILVVPHKRDQLNKDIQNSGIFNVRIYVENVPNYAYVAGHDHVGLKFPDRELYGITIDLLMLADRRFDPNLYQFYRNGIKIDAKDAVTGDVFEYITSTGVTDTLEYIHGADYYDLSDIRLDVETLPSSNYNLVYSTNYYVRVISRDAKEQFICIDINLTGLSVNKGLFQHPGKTMDEFHRNTPSPYLTNETKALDSTIALYRPFTDLLQDIMDEQDILERANWVYDCPFEVIPYLSSLLGWDIPFFPKTLDNLRRAILRRTVEFQKLKGSRKAIINLFRLFGYEILISNMWWSSDGKRLIRPDDKTNPAIHEESISSRTVYVTDVILSDHINSSFDPIKVPLLARPQLRIGIDDFTSVQDRGLVTIDAYAVELGSAAYEELMLITSERQANPLISVNDEVLVDESGFINQSAIHYRMEGKEIVGYSQLIITDKFGQVSDAVLAGHLPPFNRHSIILNRDDNVLHVIINNRYASTDNVRLFAFATYPKVDFIVPDALKHLQSNRFAIQILTSDLTEYANPLVVDFALEFVYKLKAMHSLLHLVRTRVEANETYEVTDLSVGGDFDQRYDTDIGRLQVPPAIIPNIPATIVECSLLDAKNLGYKESDLTLRLRKLANLEEEHAAWKALDGRTYGISPGQRIAPVQPDGTNNQYTRYGQDIIIIENNSNTDNSEYNPSPNANSASDNSGVILDNKTVTAGIFPITGPTSSANTNASDYGLFVNECSISKTSLKKLDGITDYQYKGRVRDELLHQSIIGLPELTRFKNCSIGLGVGVYYTYPSLAKVVRQGTSNPTASSQSSKPLLSGNAATINSKHYADGVQYKFIYQSYDKPADMAYRSTLGSLYRSYGNPANESLHYSNRIEEDSIDQTRQLALIRPSLDIEKTNLHLPGCRFPSLNALKDDFISLVHTARPWDDKYSTVCGPKGICGNQGPSFLDFTIELSSDGNEHLSYTSVPFTVAANGLIPDITSLGDHSLQPSSPFTVDDVIHKIYANDSGYNPAVVLDQLCDYDTSTIDGSIHTDNPLFKSHGTITNSAGEYQDYADGYPCVYGNMPYTGSNLDRDGLYYDVMNGLGLEVNPTASMTQYLFMCGSGIRVENGHRLDCGCLVYGNEETPTAGDIGDTICTANIYLDGDGEYDWSNDHIRVLPVMALQESIGCSTLLLDGSVTSLLETV